MNVLELCKLSKDAYEEESIIRENWNKKGYNVDVITCEKIDIADMNAKKAVRVGILQLTGNHLEAIQSLVSIHNLKAIILHKSDKVIVAFRGTDNFANVLTDINDIFYDANKIWAGVKGEVHLGFITAFVKIFQEEVYKKLPPHKEIIFTGHSLGGAIAHLSAVDLSLSTNYNGYKPVKVVTFGQPKVGNKEFINDTKNKITLWRVLNRITHRAKKKIPKTKITLKGIPIPYDDPVPGYPFSEYSHCGRKIKVSHQNNNFLVAKLLHIEAHKINNYQKSISKSKFANEII